MNEQQIPESVWWGLDRYAHQRKRAVDLADELSRIDREIDDAAQAADKAAQYLRTLREVHAAKGREHTAVHEDAGRLLFMVEKACERDGIPMPHPDEAQVGMDDLAAARHLDDQAIPLGQPVAGQARTDTRPQEVEPTRATFHPGGTDV